MKKIDKAILDIDKTISKNISRFDDSERGLLSQNILSQLRNLVEHTFLKIYNEHKKINLLPEYENFRKAEKYIKGIGRLRFLGKFHDLLQISASHYNPDENNSERLMLKYYEYLLKIKSYLRQEYQLDILSNISDFPISIDKTTQEYYEKIVEKINYVQIGKMQNDRYYIQKIKPFFVNNMVYYEVTFTKSHDGVSKFDRIIAFTKLDIPSNYAVKLFINQDYIEILGKNMPIRIIVEWEVSIRPCEINNFSYIFGIDTNIKTSHKEYKELMKFLTQTGFSLDELIKQNHAYYEYLKNIITKDAKVIFFEILDKCRDVTLNNKLGQNMIKYLLHTMNNKIIKGQYEYGGCPKLSNLHLKWGCIPFEQMPFVTSLINHNPRIHYLLGCIDVSNREHELFARLIKNNTEMKGELFTSKKEIKGFTNIEKLIARYNGELYYKHTHRKLEIYKDFIYIKGYKEDTTQIIKRLKELSQLGNNDYSKSVKSWLDESTYDIDCEDKKIYLIKMFEESKVAFIYGAAGTGKSTMINHISNFFHDKRKLYLTNTNPAIDNLKRKVKTSNCEFMTISKFLRSRSTVTEYSLLFIDESSTVGNADMLAVLEKASFQLVILVGDIFQIEAIRFGNWFEVSRSFLPKNSISELSKPYRSNNKKLLELWGKVRHLDDDILEHITKNEYSTKLDESIFENHEEDEIILCLNYDGLYGINNINSFLQNSNDSTFEYWDELVYKIDDPILFNETKRFGPSIYNNLKGKITAIVILDKQIQFEIEIDKVLNETDVEWYDLELLENDNPNKSLIRFIVNEFKSTDEDEESSDAVIPFQIAYAVSIHKAQGLEYSSVKVVITDEVEEQITHNIFYTAITRAKDKLKIYWSPETESKILQNLEKRNNQRDVGLLKAHKEI